MYDYDILEEAVALAEGMVKRYKEDMDRRDELHRDGFKKNSKDEKEYNYLQDKLKDPSHWRKMENKERESK